jgi:inner membrane protease ATP23
MQDSSSPDQTPRPPTTAFEKWRRTAALVTGLGVSPEERLAHLQMSHLEDCEKRKEALMNSST